MKQQDLPERWLDKLQNYLKEIGSKFNELSTTAFRYNLKIEFFDGSSAFFYYAFYLIDEELKEVAVFTEHCGHHIFHLIGNKFVLTDRAGKITKTDDSTEIIGNESESVV